MTEKGESKIKEDYSPRDIGVKLVLIDGILVIHNY